MNTKYKPVYMNSLFQTFKINPMNISPYVKQSQIKIIHVDSLLGKNSGNFGGFHKENESKNKIVNKHPDNEGQLLVPNYDAVKGMNFDKFLQMLGYTEEEKVWLMSRAMSEKIKIKN